MVIKFLLIFVMYSSLLAMDQKMLEMPAADFVSELESTEVGDVETEPIYDLPEFDASCLKRLVESKRETFAPSADSFMVLNTIADKAGIPFNEILYVALTKRHILKLIHYLKAISQQSDQIFCLLLARRFGDSQKERLPLHRLILERFVAHMCWDTLQIASIEPIKNTDLKIRKKWHRWNLKKIASNWARDDTGNLKSDCGYEIGSILIWSGHKFSLFFDAKKQSFFIVVLTGGQAFNVIPLITSNGVYGYRAVRDDQTAIYNVDIFFSDGYDNFYSDDVAIIVFMWNYDYYNQKSSGVFQSFLSPPLTAFLDIFILNCCLFSESTDLPQVDNSSCTHVFQKKMSKQGKYTHEHADKLELVLSNMSMSICILFGEFSFTLISLNPAVKIIKERSILDNTNNQCPKICSFSNDGLRFFLAYVEKGDAREFSHIEVLDSATGDTLCILRDSEKYKFPGRIRKRGMPLALRHSSNDMSVEIIIENGEGKHSSLTWNKNRSNKLHIWAYRILLNVARLQTQMSTKLQGSATKERVTAVKKILELLERNRKYATQDPSSFSIRKTHLSNSNETARNEPIPSDPSPLCPGIPQFCLAINGEFGDVLVSALMIKKIEELTGYPLYALFDCVVGTSAASLLALGLTASSDGEKPLLSSKQLIDFLQRHNFNSRSTKREIQQKNFSDRLAALLGNARLSNCLTRVLVPYVEQTIQNGRSSKQKPFYFDRFNAQASEVHDVFLEQAIKDSISDGEHILPTTYYQAAGIIKQRRANSTYKNNAAAFLASYKNNGTSFFDTIRNNPSGEIYLVSLSTGTINDSNITGNESLKEELGLHYKIICPEKEVHFSDSSRNSLEIYTKIAEDAVMRNKDILAQIVAAFERKRVLRG